MNDRDVAKAVPLSLPPAQIAVAAGRVLTEILGMSALADQMKEFVRYWESLEGDEKGEAQVYCDRLFKAFGHAGYKEAGAILEHRVKGKGTAGSTTYADLVWKPRVLMEMKKRARSSSCTSARRSTIGCTWCPTDRDTWCSATSTNSGSTISTSR